MASKSPWRSRVITLKKGDKNLTSQVRVNIYYERDIVDTEKRPSLPCTPPPLLEVEAYEDEAPPWSGQEEVIPETSTSEDNTTNKTNPTYKYEDARSKSVVDAEYHIRKKKVGSTNVLRFASVEEMSSYCSQNNINTSHKYMPTDKSSSSSLNWPASRSEQDQKHFIISIDEEYASKSQEFVAQQNQNAGCVATETNNFVPSCRTVCRLCCVPVLTQKKKQHIYVAHLRQPLFKCPLCEFSNLYHKANVEIHIKRKHGVSLKSISLKDDYSRDIDMWLYLCFGDRRLLRCIEPEVTNLVWDLVDWVSEGRGMPSITPLDPSTISILSNRRESSTFDPQQMPEDLLEPEVSDQPDCPKSEDIGRPKTQNTCNLCKMVNVRHMERHVLQHHVRLPMFLCPFCSYSSNYAVNSVKDHIRVKHSLTEHAQPIDLRDENWLHIRKIYDKCFVPQLIQNNLKKEKNNKYTVQFVGK